MRHGINGGSVVLAVLLGLNTLTLTASAAAPPAEAVTETIQGEQLLIESTTTPDLFTALAPGDVLEWDVSITTRDPAETIEAELLLDGNIPIEAAVFSCEEPWPQPPGSRAADCEDPAEVRAAQQVPHGGSSSESFEVPQGHHLRLVLQTGSFDTEASGEIYLRVTAQGEHIDVSPPREDPLDEQPGAVAPPEEQPEAGAPPEETAGAAQLDEAPPSDTQDAPQGEQQDSLPATGASIAIILVAALLLLGTGIYLRYRSRSFPTSTNDR